MTQKIDTYNYTVGPFDTDCNHRVAWKELGTRILSAATSHARQRGFDTYIKEDVPYLWVLSRMVIEMDRWPMVNETYQLKTWIKNYYRYFTDRYFYILDNQGQVIGRILTIWAMINSQTRQPAELKNLFGNDFDQYIYDDDPMEIQRSRIRVNHPTMCSERHTYYTDLDTNNHVNSIKYIEYILDALPQEVTLNHCVKRIEMEYCAESYIDNNLKLDIEEISPLHYMAEIIKNIDGKTITVCRSAITF